MSSTGDAATERQRTAFVAEAERIEVRHQAWAQVQRRQAAWWRRWNTLITVVAAVLAGAAGGAGLASEQYRGVAGVAALVAAALTAMASAFGTAARSEDSYAAASANQRLADRARSFRTVTAPFDPPGEVRAAFDALVEQRDKVVATAQIRLGVRNLRRFENRRPGDSVTAEPS